MARKGDLHRGCCWSAPLSDNSDVTVAWMASRSVIYNGVNSSSSHTQPPHCFPHFLGLSSQTKYFFCVIFFTMDVIWIGRHSRNIIKLFHCINIIKSLISYAKLLNVSSMIKLSAPSCVCVFFSSFFWTCGMDLDLPWLDFPHTLQSTPHYLLPPVQAHSDCLCMHTFGL